MTLSKSPNFNTSRFCPENEDSSGYVLAYLGFAGVLGRLAVMYIMYLYTYKIYITLTPVLKKNSNLPNLTDSGLKSVQSSC